jgi:hypothetical protein
MLKDQQDLQKQITKLEKPINKNQSIVERLKELIFQDCEEKNIKVDKIDTSGNFDVVKDEAKLPYYIILPSGQFRKIWDLIVFIAIFYSLIIIPIDMGYNTECFLGEGSIIQILYHVLFILLTLEIIINCFTAIPDEKNNYVYDLETIMSTYAKKNLIFDILCAIPWHLVISFKTKDCWQNYMATNKVPYFLFFLRVFKLKQFADTIEKLLKKYALAVRCVKFILICLLLPHIWGLILCGNSVTISSWYYSECSIYPPGEPLYLECIKNILLKKMVNIYVYSLYVGYFIGLGNDFIMGSSTETYLIICIIIFSTTMNAYIFGNIAVLLAQIGSDVSPILQKKMDIMEEYMYFMSIDKEFIERIEEYHLNLWFKQRTIMYPDDFFDDMNVSIRKMLLLDQWNKNFFTPSKFLGIVGDKFILDMIPNLKPKIYMKTDTIITEGDYKTEIFFMPARALCQVTISGEWVKNIDNGNFFGEIAVFLRSRRRTSTIICLKDSDFLKIEGHHYECLLKDYPVDAEKIKNGAVSKLISSIKLYPSSLFSKIVPSSNLKDYLFRKCLYLTNEEEDKFFNLDSSEEAGKDYLDPNSFQYRIEQLNDKLTKINNIIDQNIAEKESSEKASIRNF